MDNEFVVRDASHLRESEDTLRTTDQLLRILGRAAQGLATQNAALADTFEAIADIVQVSVLHHTGIEVRPVDSERADLETADIAIRSLRSQLGIAHPQSESTSEHQLRNRHQLISNLVHAFRLQRERGNETEANKILNETLSIVDGIAGSFGEETITKPISFASETVVLVEHDRQERETLQSLLSNGGSRVMAFADDDTALEFLLDKPRSGVLLLNVQHPETGRNSILRLKQHTNGANLRLIGMSSLPLHDVLPPHQFAERPVEVEWLQKPFRAPSLIQALSLGSPTSQAA